MPDKMGKNKCMSWFEGILRRAFLEIGKKPVEGVEKKENWLRGWLRDEKIPSSQTTAYNSLSDASLHHNTAKLNVTVYHLLSTLNVKYLMSMAETDVNRNV